MNFLSLRRLSAGMFLKIQVDIYRYIYIYIYIFFFFFNTLLLYFHHTRYKKKENKSTKDTYYNTFENTND